MKINIESNISELKSFLYNWEQIIHSIGDGKDRLHLFTLRIKMIEQLKKAESLKWARKDKL